MIGQPQRPGFGTLTPYLMVRHVDPVVEFLELAFDANTPGGTEPTPVPLFLYVEDTDAVHARALEAGAESMIEPGENFKEARGAAVVDPFGNRWFIATYAPKPDAPEGHDH